MSSAAVGVIETARGVVGGAQRSAMAVFAIRVVGAALAYGTQVLLARLMGAAGYGIFATVWVWIVIVGHASLWGVGQSVCRFVPHHSAHGELDLVRGFIAGGAVTTLASALAFTGAGALLLWLAQDRIGVAYVAPFAIALLVLPLFALQDYVEGVARSLSWTTLAIAPAYILRQGLIGAGMGLAVLMGAPPEPSIAVTATLFATVFALIAQTVLLVKRLRQAIPQGARAYRARQWVSATLPMAFVDLTVSGLNFADVLVLGIFVAPETVGIYFAATRIFQFVVFAQYAASASTAQRFAQASARADRTSLRQLVRLTVRLTTVATLVLGAALLICAPALLRLFGPSFSDSYNVLLVLVCGAVVQSAFGPGEDLLNMLGGERLCAFISLGALMGAFVLNLLLIPSLGVIGAAIAIATVGATRSLALSLACRRRLGVATHLLA